MDPHDIGYFRGSLISLTGKQVQVKGFTSLEIMLGLRASVRAIEVKYLVVDIMSPYNIIFRRPVLNLLGAVHPTRHLSLKYPLFDGHVGTVKGDVAATQEYYLSNLEVAREPLTLTTIARPENG